jgi:hypothetical protein
MILMKDLVSQKNYKNKSEIKNSKHKQVEFVLYMDVKIFLQEIFQIVGNVVILLVIVMVEKHHY